RGLSKRAVEILRLLAEGLSDREIAERLVMTIGTVKWYNRQIYRTLGVGSRTQAIASAKELGPLGAPGTVGAADDLPSPWIGLPSPRVDHSFRGATPRNSPDTRPPGRLPLAFAHGRWWNWQDTSGVARSGRAW